jgi:hypothetical protein
MKQAPGSFLGVDFLQVFTASSAGDGQPAVI